MQLFSHEVMINSFLESSNITNKPLFGSNCSDFRKKNGIFMLGAVFLFSQFSPIEIIVFEKKLYRIEGIDFRNSNV